MKKALGILTLVAIAAVVYAETDPIAGKRLKEIAKGTRVEKYRINDLYVADDVSVGDAVSITGDLTVGGNTTLTGTVTAAGTTLDAPVITNGTFNVMTIEGAINAGAGTGFSGVVTNISALSTNVIHYYNGIVTNAVVNP